MTNEEVNNMKLEIVGKAQCMIDTYKTVLDATEKMLKESFDDRFETERNEILKRADMFWNISLQRVDMEKQQLTHGNNMMPTMPMMADVKIIDENKVEKSPCAERAEKAAKEAYEAGLKAKANA